MPREPLRKGRSGERVQGMQRLRVGNELCALEEHEEGQCGAGMQIHKQLLQGGGGE